MSADWLKLRDHILVQCSGTGVITIPLRPSGRCRTNCRAIILASPILPPYFRRSATCADKSSYLTTALMPSCFGGLSRQFAHCAPSPRSKANGEAHPLHHGGLRKCSFCQQSTQNGPPAGVITPQHGHLSGITQVSEERKISMPIAMLRLSDNASVCTRRK
jgi:hypothetical protein